MRGYLATIAFAALLPVGAAMAGAPTATPITNNGHPTFLLGLGVEFGDTTSSTPDVGITGKIISSDLSNHFVVGAGATYFPWSAGKPIGVDISAGFNATDFGVLGGYDFIRQKPELSAGFVPTESSSTTCPSGYSLSGGSCFADVSDRRRKRDIRHLATLSDGIRLYSFRYLWSDTVYVGVMAQDLLEDTRFRHAVLTDADGFYRVEYDKLDLVMVTLEQWLEHGLDAVVLGTRPAELLAPIAA